jgi:hypothetical protein
VSLTTPTLALVITTPTASGLSVLFASRYGPEPRKISTFVAP